MINLEDDYGSSNDKERGLKIYQELLYKIRSQVSNSKFKKITKILVIFYL